MPHTHEVNENADEHGSRAHVHLTWHGSDHEHGNDQCHRDTDRPSHHSVPDHGDDVVYFDGSLEWIASPKADGFEVARSLDWVASLKRDHPLVIVAWPPSSGLPRPPGDSADAIHIFFPHVLRI